MTNDLFRRTSAELIAHYRIGDVSPVEVARALLRRLQHTQPVINPCLRSCQRRRSPLSARARRASRASENWSCCPFTWICNLTRQPATSAPWSFLAGS